MREWRNAAYDWIIIVRSEFYDLDRLSLLYCNMDLDSISTIGDSADSNEHEQIKLACHLFRVVASAIL
jgi:hypothetical protein